MTLRKKRGGPKQIWGKRKDVSPRASKKKRWGRADKEVKRTRGEKKSGVKQQKKPQTATNGRHATLPTTGGRKAAPHKTQRRGKPLRGGRKEELNEEKRTTNPRGQTEPRKIKLGERGGKFATGQKRVYAKRHDVCEAGARGGEAVVGRSSMMEKEKTDLGRNKRVPIKTNQRRKRLRWRKRKGRDMDITTRK